MTKKRTKAIRLGRPLSSPSKMSHARIVNTVLLQPWFLPQRIAFAIHSLVPPEFWNKMRYYFEDYGCMVCKAETGYHSNGMCRRCSQVIRKKLAASLGRRTERRMEPRLDLALFRQEKAAKKLLRQFSVCGPGSSQKRSIEIQARNNPVYEALVARLE